MSIEGIMPHGWSLWEEWCQIHGSWDTLLSVFPCSSFPEPSSYCYSAYSGFLQRVIPAMCLLNPGACLWQSTRLRLMTTGLMQKYLFLQLIQSLPMYCSCCPCYLKESYQLSHFYSDIYRTPPLFGERWG